MTSELIRLESVSVVYRRGKVSSPVVRDVSLGINIGETLGLVGESGSGKSTIGNVILGLVPAAGGRILFDGEDITHVGSRRRRELTREIQVVFQDPYGSLNPTRTVGATLTESIRAQGNRESSRSIANQVAHTLEAVGMSSTAAQRYPTEFSGGQRQRIAIARALVVNPRLIVCDEAVSALDLSIQAQVLNLLKQLKEERGLSYLFISHDLAVVAHAADRIAVLERGTIAEYDTVDRVMGDPQHPYTRMLLAAAPVPNPDEQAARRRLFLRYRERYLSADSISV
ncbi:MAG: ATP-binding cassette domain-containing protein [Leucobacter sp.]